MGPTQDAKIICSLEYLGIEIDLLHRLAEKYIEHAPRGADDHEVAAYVETHITQLAQFDEEITSTRRDLLTRGVDIPDEWLTLPIKLGVRNNADTGELEIDPEIAARWKAVRTAIEVRIERLTFAPSNVANGPVLPIIFSDERRASITWRNIEHPVDFGTADAFRAMIEKQGQPIGLGTIVRKPAEWKAGLPPALSAIVEKADGNKGYRLTIFDAPNVGRNLP